MNLFLIYLLVMIPTVKGFLEATIGPAGIVLAILLIVLFGATVVRQSLGKLFKDPGEPTAEEQAATESTTKAFGTGWKYFRSLGYAYLAAGLLFVALPSERQMYVMAGAYVVTNIDGIGNLPDNAVGAANAWLKKLGETVGDDAAVAQDINKAQAALPAAPVK